MSKLNKVGILETKRGLIGFTELDSLILAIEESVDGMLETEGYIRGNVVELTHQEIAELQEHSVEENQYKLRQLLEGLENGN